MCVYIYIYTHVYMFFFSVLRQDDKGWRERREVATLPTANKRRSGDSRGSRGTLFSHCPVPPSAQSSSLHRGIGP